MSLLKIGMARLITIECGRCPYSFLYFKLFENPDFSNVRAHWIGTNGSVKDWWRLRRAAFAAGFHDFIESGEPIHELPSVTQMIRDKL